MAVPTDLIPAALAADMCGVDPRTFVRWCATGRLEAYRIVGRWRVSQAVVEQFIRTSRYNPPGAD